MTDFIVTTSADDLFNGGDLAAETADGGGLSLREALGLAALLGPQPDYTFISFDHVATSSMVVVTEGELTVATNVIIDGGAGQSIFGDYVTRVLAIEDGAWSSLLGLNISGGVATGLNGGGVYVGAGANVSLQRLTLNDNQAGLSGGGLYVATGAQVEARAISAMYNTAGGAGGGVAVADGATFTYHGADLEISANVAAGNGGGLSVSGVATIGGGFFIGNQGQSGGGINVAAGASFVSTGQGLIIADNTASAYGGGVNALGVVTINGGEIARNTAQWGGGVDLDSSGALTLTNATMHANSATAGKGGAIDAYSGTFTINSSTLTGNSASQDAGGIYIKTGGVITNTIIAGNAAPTGVDVKLGTAALASAFGPANILGEAATIATGGTATFDPASVLVLSGAGLAAADVFAAIDEATGGGLAAANGGVGATVALALSGANPALGGADAATVAPTDGRGLLRDPGAADIGAFEEFTPQEAPSLVVTTMADAVDAYDGVTSLREAVGFVNAGTLAGTITFAAGGVLALSLGELTITGAVAIDGDVDGNGVGDVALDAGGLSRVLNVAGGALALAHLVVAGGQVGTGGGGGGGILVTGGALALDSVVIVGNTSGVAGDWDSVGGGVSVVSGSTLTGRDVRIVGNAASLGGAGLFVSGSAASLVNAEISGNTVSDAYGGGIWAESGTLDLVNATVHGNAAGLEGGGVLSTAATVDIDHSTITANQGLAYHGGGVVAYQGALTVANSIIAGNTGALALGNDLMLGAPDNGLALSLDAVLLGEAAYHESGSTPFAPSPAAGTTVLDDLGLGLGDVFAALDGAGAPVLAGNGGSVNTVALAEGAGNPALGAATASLDTLDADADGDVAEALPVDARGVIRAGGVDLGAYEVLTPDPLSLTVTTTLDLVDAFDGLVSLREAIGYVQTGALSGVITFASGAGDAFEGGGTALLNGAALVITGVVAIAGGAGGVGIDAGGLSRVFEVENGGDLGLASDLTVTGGAHFSGGGALVRTGGALTLNGTTVDGNSASSAGGGVAVEGGGTLTAVGATFIANAADGRGGAIAGALGSIVDLSDTTVISNSAGGFGGGIETAGWLIVQGLNLTANFAGGDGGGIAVSTGGSLDGDTVLFDHNTAAQDGGGMSVSGIALVSNAVFTGNQAARGGGLAVAGGGFAALTAGAEFAANIAAVQGGAGSVAAGGVLTIKGGDFSYNNAGGGAGGGIVASGDLIIAAGTFTGNYASGAGGAIASLVGGTLVATDTTMTGNISDAQGGGLYVAGVAQISRMHIDGGTAMSGGGAAVAAGGVLTGRDVALIGNLAASDGGGLLALGTTQIANADIGGNAAYTGGGVYSVGGNLTLSNATIHDNVASLWGGGIRGHDGVIDISSSTITGNAATGGSAYEPASGGGIMMTSSAAGLTITNTIIAGNAATAGADMTTGDTPTGLRGVILGEAAQQWYGGALALPTDQALVLTDMGLTTADVFGAVTGAGGGVAAANGGFGDTVALAAAIANPATGSAVARPGVALDPGDLDADGVTDEAIPFDARGVARPSLGADIGAYEAPTLETPSLLVTTMADIVNDSDGLTSLREAVAYASLGTEGRTVQFATGGVATLDHGALALDGILTIYGDVNGDGAADVTIDAQGLSRVAVVGSVGVELTAVDLTGGLSAGNGGAIEVLDGAYLRTVRVSVSGSVAGGDGGAIHVATGGHMTAYDTVVSDNRASGSGGGIAVGVGAEFRASGLDVAGNYAEFGGGIHFDHAAGLIQNATVHGNQAHWGGGGIALVSSGVTVDATTLTGNYANGQIFGGGEGNGSGNPGYGGGLLITGVAETEPSITNTLIVGNGVGGVVDAGGLAGIVPAKGADMSLGGGAAPVFSGVLVGEDVGAAVTGLLIDGNAYDLFWVTALSSFGLGSADVFAQVSGVAGVVADNGGPIRTAALLASPLNLAVDGAIAASLDPLNVDGDGATATLPVDARGEARDAAQDIGSYELPPSDAPSLVVTSTGDVTDAFDGVTTLREAIAWVESGALTGVITFAHGAGEAFETRGTYVTLGGSELLVSGEVSIDGDLGGDRPGVQIYAALLSRAVRVADGGALTLMNTSLEGGVAQGDGGGALVQTGGALTLDGVNITSNRTEGGDGGGVFVEAGATLVGRDLFVGYNGAASLSAYEHTFGGGIGAMGAVSLVNATLTRNAAENGGGIGVFGGAATLVNVTVVENYGYVGGAGVSVAGGGSAIIDHSTITANETIAGDGGAGGGIAAVASDVTLTNSIVVGNVDSEAGVATDVAVDGGVLTAGRDTLFGVAATDLAGAPAAGIGARVLAAEGLTGADIFAAAGPLGEGAVTYEAFNDRGASIVALAAVAGNVALGSAISAPDMLDADGDGDVAEALPVDVRGVARAAIGGDLGAYEVTTTFDGAPSLLVTTTSDAINDSDGETSLREALGYLQSGALSGAITFASGAGEAFENGAAITLYGGELALSGVIAIDGDVNGDGVADVTLDAGGASRAVDVAAGADVRLSHLIVTGGDAGAENGGGIRLAGGAALDLDGVTVAGSFAAQGGGIFADYGAVLTARDLVLTGNGAGGIGGGGLASKGGDVTIVNAEISGNTSESNGGGIVAYYFGDIRLVNVTLHGNAAEYGGGMMLTQSTATLDHVTVAGNSAAGAGGMSVSGDLAITNSVIADNEVTGAYPANPDLWVDSYSGDVTGASGVLLGSAAYHDDLYTAFAAPGMAAVDPASLFAAYDDAGVPVLADNGGPVKTVALSPEAGNPALDVALPVFGAGIDADGDGSPDPILSVDARGVARPWISDIGAYEAPGVLAKSLVVTTAADVMSDFDGETSLREAIGWVQDGSLTGTITFASGAGGAFAGGGTIVLNGTELLITGAVAIDGDIGGDGTADVTIDAGGLSRVINVAGGAADLTGLAITGGHVGTGSHGGGILVDGAGALTLSAVRIAGNSAGVAGDFDSLGGGVAVFGGSSLTARDVAFNRNTASLGGGGIYLEGEASLVNAEIAGNLATDVYGGGIWAGLGALSMTNATVHGNVAGLEGGGVFSSAATVSIDHSTITANEALTYHGGGVVAYQGSLSVTNSIIAGNTGALADGNDLLLGAPDNGMAVSLDAVLLGEAAHHTSQFTPFAPSPAAGTMVMADLGVTLSDVFAAFDGSGAPVLAANGGFARTVALEGVVGNPALAASSPALDPLDADGDGDVAEGLPVDARGVARGALSDLGAYEAPALDGDLRYVTTTLDVVNDSDGLVSLREALSYANAESGPADVRFDSASLGGGTVFTLTGGALEVTGDVTFHGDIDGNGAGDVVIDANAASRALAVSDGGRATLNDMTLTGGYAATGFGGAILVDGGASLRIDRSFVTDSAAAAGGGGIFVDIGGALVGANSVITGNAASAGNGGGLLSRGDVTLQGVEIGGNQAISGGGAMVDGGVTRLLNATIHGNIAASFGGGVASLGAGGVTLTNATVTGNTAKAFAGGGVLLGGVGAPSLIENSIVAGNAGPRGADVALMGGDWGVQNTLFGTAALTDGRAGHDAAASVVPVLADMGVGLDKVFETLDAAGLGGLATDMGGIGKTVALAATFSNPAIDAGLDLIDTDALGAPRAVAFIDPFGVDAADLGAVEAVRQALPGLVGLLATGAPVVGDLGAGAADLSGAAADFDGAALANLSADDALLFAGATSAAQFGYDGTFLTYDSDLDGVAEATTWLSLAPNSPPLTIEFDAVAGGVAISASAPVPLGNAIGEVVQITVGTDWQTINFANTYNNAVVFALAPSLNEVESAATRFRNIDATGGEIKLQETRLKINPVTGLPETNISGHVNETVTLLVLEAGKHTLEDGTVIRVSELFTSKLYVKGFESIGFSSGMTTTPSIFSQVQTYNGSDFIISRQRNPTTSGFDLTMQEEQADNLNHATETVGWLAIEHGSGSWSTMDWQAGSSAQNVNGKLTNVSFSAAFDEAPLVVASLASYNGTDTSSPRVGSVGTSGFTAMALEDQSFDLETNHGYEIVDWLAFSNAGIIYDGSVPAPVALNAPLALSMSALSVAEPEVAAPSLVAQTGKASVGSDAVTVSFGATFVNPVVIATLTSAYDVGAAIARVSNVTATGFDVAVQETGDQDGVHGAEDVSWIVVEAGTWVLADGTMIQAGLTDLGLSTKQGFASIDFEAGFDADRAVLSQTQTANDAAFVKTRMDGVDGTGFAVALEEDEASHWGAHGSETVGWIAVDAGLAMGADGFAFEAGTLRARDGAVSQGFDADLADVGVVAGIASFAGPDTAAARLGALTETGFEAWVEEDLSFNPETSHRAEDISWLAFDGASQIWGDALA